MLRGEVDTISGPYREATYQKVNLALKYALNYLKCNLLHMSPCQNCVTSILNLPLNLMRLVHKAEQTI